MTLKMLYAGNKWKNTMLIDFLTLSSPLARLMEIHVLGREMDKIYAF